MSAVDVIFSYKEQHRHAQFKFQETYHNSISLLYAPDFTQDLGWLAH